MHTPLKIANYFLALADAHDAEIDPLKLQKLLYYAQGYSLALRGTQIFEEDFQAWTHGPVLPTIYRKFKVYGSNDIPAPSETEFAWSQVDDDTADLLDEVWDEFGRYSGWALRNMTHSEPPWREGHKREDQVISKKALKRYFETRVRG